MLVRKEVMKLWEVVMDNKQWTTTEEVMEHAKKLWENTYKFYKIRARKLARHKNSVPRVKIDDEPVEKSLCIMSKIGF